MKVSIFGYPNSNYHENAEKLAEIFGCSLYTAEEAAKISIWDIPGPWVVEGLGEYEFFDKQLYASDMCVFYDPPAFKCAMNALKSKSSFARVVNALLFDRKGPLGLVIRDTSNDYKKKYITINNKKQWEDFLKGANKLASGVNRSAVPQKIEIPEDDAPEDLPKSKYDE